MKFEVLCSFLSLKNTWRTLEDISAEMLNKNKDEDNSPKTLNDKKLYVQSTSCGRTNNELAVINALPYVLH